MIYLRAETESNALEVASCCKEEEHRRRRGQSVESIGSAAVFMQNSVGMEETVPIPLHNRAAPALGSRAGFEKL
ncbi:hypothetical protein KOW79_014319 [Hemibagrus wyckioides]|uniref:Uncharacterized protein n=1 Tax=Hemibagrus wyckioides TaxID=337641 RepID=A0A9D3NHI2_9TELE|nr:hypothetical protein KOW79_014319 [Hemibagrus wyckioides]